MIFQGINVVSVQVPDLAAARVFYAEVLGLGEPDYDLPEEGWIEFRTGGAGNLSLVPAAPGWAPSEAIGVVLNVTDCAQAVKILRDRGVRCDDPFGNRLQFCSPAP